MKSIGRLSRAWGRSPNRRAVSLFGLLVERAPRHEMIGVFNPVNLLDFDIKIPGKLGDVPTWIVSLTLGNQNRAIALASRRADFIGDTSHRTDRAVLGDSPGERNAAPDPITFEQCGKSHSHDSSGARAVGAGCGISNTNDTDGPGMVDRRRMLERILKGEDHGAQVGLPWLDVAALPLQHDWRRAWLVIPAQQEYFEDAEVVRLNGSQHGNLNSGLRIGRPEVSEQQTGAKAEQTENPQIHAEESLTPGSWHMRASVAKLVMV